jgi:DNA helicase II / ATP-dependent DNA helicase PcrA
MDEALFVGLNPEQRRAAMALDGPLCIKAGAGSGKTRVVTRRIAHLLARGVAPDSILAVTFTNKAAREMRDRVMDLTGVLCPTVTTFHAWCARVLRSDFSALGRSPDFTIYDEADARALMRDVVDELELDSDRLSPGDLVDHVSARRNARPGLEPEWSARATRTDLEGVDKAAARYLERLVEANAVDFDGLLVETVRLFETSAATLAAYRARYSHVLVDEFQDTNFAQYRLVRMLTEESRNLCVTGDPDQSIYSWRGADPRNFEDFRRDFPEAEEVVLSRNYRSTNAILRAASEVMRRAPKRVPKSLWSELGEGEAPRVVEFPDDRMETDAAAESVASFEADGFPRGRQAIMFRTNALSGPIERALVARGIRYRVLGGPEFFGRAEVRDLLAYLRLVANPYDGQALARVVNTPPRGIGDKTRDALFATARARGFAPLDALRIGVRPEGLRKKALESLDAFAALVERLLAHGDDDPRAALDAVLDETDYATWLKDRPSKQAAYDPLKNVEELRAFAREFSSNVGGDLRDFLEHVALASERERDDGGVEPVTLLTIHAAKGLEFDSVILVGCEDDLLPHATTRGDAEAVEEERRLLHVAMTRARRRLVLTVAARRLRYGRPSFSAPSRFLADLKDVGVRFERAEYGGGGYGERGFDAVEAFEPSRRVELDDDAVEADDPVARLKSGAAVSHPQWGRGEVVRFRGRARGLDAIVVVRFVDGAERQMPLRYAKLTPLDDGEDVVF